MNEQPPSPTSVSEPQTLSEKVKALLTRKALNKEPIEYSNIAREVGCSEALVRKIHKRIAPPRPTPSPATTEPQPPTLTPPEYGEAPPPLIQPPPTPPLTISPVPFTVDLKLCEGLGKLPYEVLAVILKNDSFRLLDGEAEALARSYKCLLDYYLPVLFGKYPALAVFLISQGMVAGTVIARVMATRQAKKKEGEATSPPAQKGG